jgi:hypothetical protein
VRSLVHKQDWFLISTPELKKIVTIMKAVVSVGTSFQYKK